MYKLNTLTNLKSLTKNFSFNKIKINQIFTNNKLFTRMTNISKLNFYVANSIKNFSSNSNNQEDEGIHSDFKPQVKQEVTNENVMAIIDDWVKNNDAVLFMKGTREMPRCGFSNYVVQIMNFYKIKKVKCINILESAVLREAVKQYSNWPTYPQFYVKGNLIGGCDILKEMHENGTLKELVEREGLAEQN